MPKFVSVSIALVALLGFVALSGVGGPLVDGKASATAAEGTYKLVVPLDVIMTVGDDMFYELPDKVDANKLKTVGREALFLAELSNLYGHVEYEEVKTAAQKKEWKKYCDSNKDNFLKMAAASKAKNVKEVKGLHAKVEVACDSCHEKFRDI